MMAEVTDPQGATAGDPAATPRPTAATGPPPPAIRVVVVDDEPLVRDGFRMIVDAQPDMSVVGVAADGDEAVAVVVAQAPDVVLMDVRMPNTDGITATRRIVEAGVDSRVIVLTTFDHDEYVHGALRAGASGFMLKRLTSADLLQAIRVVATGEALLAPSITRRLIEQFSATAGPAGAGQPMPTVDLARRYRLTDREIDIFHQLAAGLGRTPRSPEALDVREATVKTHHVEPAGEDRLPRPGAGRDPGLRLRHRGHPQPGLTGR